MLISRGLGLGLSFWTRALFRLQVGVPVITHSCVDGDPVQK